MSDGVLLDTDCTSSTILDLIGYGSSASCYEGSAAPGGSNTRSIARQTDALLNTLIDTDDNAFDFIRLTPNPRNMNDYQLPAGFSPDPTINPVSEPSSLLLLLGGGLAAMGRRRGRPKAGTT